MNRLEENFGDQIAFYHLDVDVSEHQEMMGQFGIRSRTTYVLTDAEGNEVQRWVGPLDAESLTQDIEAALAELESQAAVE